MRWTRVPKPSMRAPRMRPMGRLFASFGLKGHHAATALFSECDGPDLGAALGDYLELTEVFCCQARFFGWAAGGEQRACRKHDYQQRSDCSPG